jgi:Protein of unknown function (DUF3604)
VVHQGEIVLAFSDAQLESETIHLGTFIDGVRGHREVGTGFRPTLSVSGGTVALAFCSWRGDHFAPMLHREPHGEPRPVTTLPCMGDVHTVDLAPADPGFWIVWTEQEVRQGSVCIGRLDGEGRLTPIERFPGRDPVLGSHAGRTRLVWIDRTGLWVGDLGRGGVGRRSRVCPGSAWGAPALAGGDDGWRVAWHAVLGDRVIRWIHVAREIDGVWTEQLDVTGIEAASEGVDQGWEHPALLVDGGGNTWVAGRSSGGFHVQAQAQGRWTERLDLSQEGWSGRSRTCALVEVGGEVMLLRGTPGGVIGTRLQLEAGARSRPKRSTTAPIVLPSAPATAPAGWPRVLFGDPHQHTIHSDGTGSAEEAYSRAREVYGHDLASVTDHEKLGRQCLGPATWRYLCQVADAHYEPGRFVTLRAYEFTGARLPGPGHKCVYFGDSVPERLPDKDRDALHAVLREHGAIAVPHHVGWTGADLEHHDPALQPVWEICSAHGAYEHAGEQRIAPRDDVLLEGQFIRDALDAGLVFGFIGGTDSHGLRWHHGVCRIPDPYRAGLTAVFSEPTREAVLAALRARRCYATSGARIYLRVDVEGAPMGSAIEHPGRPLLRVEARGSAPIERLSVVQDGREVHATAGEGDDASAACTVRLELTAPQSYCYARVLQRDGEMAWSSPVFITSR